MTHLKNFGGVIAGVIMLCLFCALLTARPRIDKSTLVAYVDWKNTPGLLDKGALYVIPPDMKISLEALSRKSLQDPKSADVSKAVFVTAADYTHFDESKDSIASIQKHVPKNTIIYYDLGLRSSFVKEVKSWCGVKYSQLNFTKYPAHVKNLGTYAWKPLIIQEVLQEHDTIVWFDASVRVKCPNMLKQLEPTIRKSGITTTDSTGHSSFATTNPGMYNFLSVDKNLTTNIMMGASFIALTNSRQLFEHVIRRWVHCALWKDCIAPHGSGTACHFSVKNRITEYASCHRYDQSALNLLLLDMFKGDVSLYRTEGACVTVERGQTWYHQLQHCKNK